MLLNLITILIIVLGGIKTYQMNKEAFPAIDFDIVSILTIYPGASPSESELYVTNPIEDELKKVSGIDKVESTSVENWSSVIVYIDPERSDAQKNKTISDIQRAVDTVKDLPDEIPDPPKVESIDSGDMPVLEVSLYGNKTYAELHEIGVAIAERLEDLADVKDANIRGFREKEFWIEVDPDKLAKYNIGLSSITLALKSRNLNLPGGVLKGSGGEILVRTIGEIQTAEQISNLVLRNNSAGITIKIRDIGEVRETFEEQKKIYRSNAQNSINILVNKKATGDIIDLVEDVKRETRNYLQLTNNDDIEVAFINDMSVFVKNRLGVLLSNGYIGTGLVLLVLLLFLSKGIAFVTALGMPVAFLGCLMVMGYMGTTVNLISMFALVIVLGMLVDDAIIVAENIWQYYENGETPFDACVKGTTEVFWPVTATIATTIAAFSPLLMISGIFGKFIAVMPQVVIIALIASLVEAMLVLPSHAYEILKLGEQFGTSKKKRNKKGEAKTPRVHEVGFVEKFVNRAIDFYEKLLGYSLRFRYLITAIFIILLSVSSWYAQTKMKKILFPTEGIEAFFVRVSSPHKTSLLRTSEKIAALEKVIANLPASELKDYVAHIGEIRDDQQDPLARYGAHVAQIQVFLTPEKDRERSADEIIDFLRIELAPLKTQQEFDELYFSPIRLGPPVGKPVAIRIRGENLEEMNGISDLVQKELTSIEGVSDIADNYNQGKDELKIIVDEQKAAQSLLSVQEIALHVRAAIEGQISSYIRKDGDRIAVRVRYQESERKETEDLKRTRIVNRAGHMVKLSNVATFEESESVQAIIHHDYKRTITVTANVDEALTSSSQVNETIAPFLVTLQNKFPLLTIEKGGEYQDTDESIESLGEAFLVAIVLIFVILATQFRSLTQPLVVMLVIPFGSIGVVAAFVAHDMPLSFLGMIGLIGLSGVVVNDSIVLVDFINNARAKGMGVYEAIIYAGRRRFRAVWLTTLTTVFGLIPLVYGWGGHDLFLKPAATALGYGLIFGTLLVLFLVPTVYLIRVDAIKLLHKLIPKLN